MDFCQSMFKVMLKGYGKLQSSHQEYIASLNAYEGAKEKLIHSGQTDDSHKASMNLNHMLII